MRRALLSVLALALLLGPLAVLAQSPSLGPRRDTAWEQEGRSLEWRLGYTDALLTSKRDTALAQDRWDLAIDARTGTLRLNATGVRPDGNTSTQLAVRVRSLIEYQDGDGDGRFGLGDPVVQQILLSDGNGWVESVRRPDGQVEPHLHYWLKGARLDILFHPTSNGTVTGGGSPTATAFEIRVGSFPYLSDNQTHLAVEFRVDGPLEVAGSALATPAGALRSFLAWQTPEGNVSVPGVTLQQYLGEPSHEWLLLVSQPRHSFGPLPMAVGIARIEAEATFPEILRQITGDWRLYVAGLLVASIAVGLPLYRKMRDGPGGRR